MTVEKSSREKESAALFSIFAAFGLASAKLVVGFVTGSLGIISEAVHSGLDLMASLMTFTAVKIAKKPPDASHPYGHGKVENISALIEAILLFLVCFWIVYEAVLRILHQKYEIDVNIWAYSVMVLSVTVDFSRYSILKRVAKKHNSAALEADALHFFSDMFTSLTVLAGLFLVSINFKIGDSIASILIAVYIMYLSYRLGRKTILSLMDTVPESVFDRVNTLIGNYPDILGYSSLRVRSVGEKVFIDFNVKISRQKTFEKSHDIADRLEHLISRNIKNADVVIHAEPVELFEEGIEEKIRNIVSNFDVSFHDLIIRETEGKYDIDVDMEFDFDLSLKEAFEVTVRIKEKIINDIPEINTINVHLEDKSDKAKKALDVTEEHSALTDRIKEVLDTFPEILGYHNLKIYRIGDSLKCILHCEFDRELSVQRVHEIIGKVENKFKENIMEIDYIIIQPEPKI